MILFLFFELYEFVIYFKCPGKGYDKENLFPFTGKGHQGAEMNTRKRKKINKKFLLKTLVSQSIFEIHKNVRTKKNENI